MHNILTLSARELAARVSRRELTAEAVTRAYIEQIQACEPSVKAWQFFDAEIALQSARALDCNTHSSDALLLGVPVGVKDLMDTADMPTAYGSPIYAGQRPAFDAACVAACRDAGMVVLGKTVTTEFATFQPGVTRNPRAPADAPRTPGGSSSGSAAAVAASMVPLALGTQTAGSIVRPASYCGVVGYKPSHGTLPLAGIKPLSPSLDTVGAFARSVDDVAFFVGALTRVNLDPQRQSALRVGICRTPHWDLASDDARRVLEHSARQFEKVGAHVHDFVLPASFDGLSEAQIQIMAYEAAAAFAPERQRQAEKFSPAFAQLLALGQSLHGTDFAAAQLLAIAARRALDAVFASVDVLIAPSAEGEAPAGLDATGNPIFSRLWTLLGNPCVHVPAGTGVHGMPVGVTVIGPRWADALTLSAAHTLELSLS
ncbi:amidase [Polaromonas sp. CG_9.11]|uniref:amidase n=1 Tax=Polaromonas sp. CG_9.11 TaxID=2787730 RepID=UPI00056D4E2D|nr:amidase [Polaromonas sp. CG_9.11]MBG6078142.1 amidase [Polaromonas sp. CG_9.11]